MTAAILWQGIAEGKCLRLGDNVGIDDIIASHYVKDPQAMKNPDKLRKHFFETIQPGLGEALDQRCIIVGGRNFGHGSSREHPVRLLKALGVPAILAVSFARSFYRNCVNLGLPVLEGEPLEKLIGSEDLKVNALRGEVLYGENSAIKLSPLPGFVKEIGEAGGLIPYILGQGQY